MQLGRVLSRFRWPYSLRDRSALECWDCGFESHQGHGCLCCKDNGTRQDNQDIEMSTEKVQREEGLKNSASSKDVCLHISSMLSR